MTKGNILAALDIGTSKIMCVIGEVNAKQELNVLGVGAAPSEGFKKGFIVDIDATVKGIRMAVEQAERMANTKIDSVFLGMSGAKLELLPTKGVVAVTSESGEVTREDIERVNAAARVMNVPDGRQILDLIPTQYIVDGCDGIRSPEGMFGVRLEIEANVVLGSATTLQNLVRTVERADLHVMRVIINPLLMERAVITSDEKDMGVVVADVGGTMTDVMLFKDGQLKACTSIPIGGDYITNDLAICLKTSFQNAEDIKRSIGVALVSAADPDKTIEVDVIGKADRETYDQVQIAEIIEPRVQEIFAMIRKTAESFQKEELNIASAIVVGGGVTFMDGYLDVAAYQLGTYVRAGETKYAGVQHPKYAACVGLLEYARTYRPASGRVERSSGDGLFKRLFRWIKDNF